MSAARIIGVLGAGTMGSGIAQLACRSGARTLLHDPIPDALQRGLGRARDGLQKEAAKGRLKQEEAQAGIERLEAVEDLAAFAPCELVIEAVPERLELKHELYRQLSEIVGEQCVLATNTSSLLVTAIAAGATHPERVVGMHFFNPAPIMRLLEVVAGEQSSEDALALAHATGEAMGKTVIRAHDGPGFLVNRCNRPFGLEALRLLTRADRGHRDDRPDRARRGRLSHGSLRADGPRWSRHGPGDLQELLRAELRRAALAPFPDRRPLCRRRPVRPQDRTRLLRLLARSLPSPGPRPTRAAPAPMCGPRPAACSSESSAR